MLEGFSPNINIQFKILDFCPTEREVFYLNKLVFPCHMSSQNYSKSQRKREYFPGQVIRFKRFNTKNFKILTYQSTCQDATPGFMKKKIKFLVELNYSKRMLNDFDYTHQIRNYSISTQGTTQILGTSFTLTFHGFV